MNYKEIDTNEKFIKWLGEYKIYSKVLGIDDRLIDIDYKQLTGYLRLYKQNEQIGNIGVLVLRGYADELRVNLDKIHFNLKQCDIDRLYIGDNISELQVETNQNRYIKEVHFSNCRVIEEILPFDQCVDIFTDKLYLTISSCTRLAEISFSMGGAIHFKELHINIDEEGWLETKILPGSVAEYKLMRLLSIGEYGIFNLEIGRNNANVLYESKFGKVKKEKLEFNDTTLDIILEAIYIELHNKVSSKEAIYLDWI